MSVGSRPNEVERAALDDFRADAATRRRAREDDAEWTGFGLRCLLEASRFLRSSAGGRGEPVSFKGDGSPATRAELEVEEAIRARLAVFEPSAVFVGEESGGKLPASGLAVAVDPVDGTWGFLTETPTWASTLAVFRDGVPLAGFVANPSTGELAYALRGGRTRCLRISAFGEGDSACTFPAASSSSEGKVLVTLHPSLGTEAAQSALHEAWNRGELGMVRSCGGSPAWGLLEAARGHYVYANAWSKRPAEPYELAAGVLLVRGAGGEVTDLRGQPIDLVSHAGAWIAAVDLQARAKTAAILDEIWLR